MTSSLDSALRRSDPIHVQGEFLRHAVPNRDPLAGGQFGRWGLDFPVIYLGRPEQSVVAEAYRHLVDATGVAASHVKPRTLYTMQANVTHVLDLTSATNLRAVGLKKADLQSEVDDYAACQAVAEAACRSGWHGILAPSASGLGETLAAFRDHLPLGEVPHITARVTWARLPADPRG